MNLMLIVLGIVAAPLLAWIILTGLFVLLRSLLGLAHQPQPQPVFARATSDIATARI